MKFCEKCDESLHECRCHMSNLRIGASLQRFNDRLIQWHDEVQKDDHEACREFNRGYRDALGDSLELFSEIFGHILEHKR